MAHTYARGSRAWGICQKCGLRTLRRKLVEDGDTPGLLVHSQCRDPKHPQETPRPVSDAIAIYRPSPDTSVIGDKIVLPGYDLDEYRAVPPMIVNLVVGSVTVTVS